MIDYDDILAQIDEETEEGWDTWRREFSPLLYSYLMIRSFLRSAVSEVSLRYINDKCLNEFAQHLCVGVIIFGWRVISNDGEKVSLVREGINKE